MTNPVEPSDVGPAVGGDLTAADTDRDHVISLLTAAHSEGRLTAVERDQRVAAARLAETFDDLVPLTRDLVGPQSAARPVVSYDQGNPTEAADQIVAVFAGATRKHTWRVRKHTSILTVFGGAELDLTQATFEARELEFNVFCLFGGVELTVPPGTEVDNQVMAVLGGSDVGKLAPPDPSAPRITVKGFVGFGGIEIRNPKVRKRQG
ncbi:MAG: DUF1707 and DUF2154 domain-containing protein [Propionibacteriaceae bacterium]|nr:DUF1707 and DUF2154 domain-containing protein [Propionibacteriaceae bacterium]